VHWSLALLEPPKGEPIPPDRQDGSAARTKADCTDVLGFFSFLGLATLFLM